MCSGPWTSHIKYVYTYKKNAKKERDLPGWVGGSQKRATSTRAGSQELLRLLLLILCKTGWTEQDLIRPPDFES